MRKSITGRIMKESEKTETGITIYVSPNNLGILVMTLTNKESIPIIIAQKPEHQQILQEISEQYGSQELDNISIAVVSAKEYLSTEKGFKIDNNIKPHSFADNTLGFGKYDLKDIIEYFNSGKVPNTKYNK